MKYKKRNEEKFIRRWKETRNNGKSIFVLKSLLYSFLAAVTIEALFAFFKGDTSFSYVETLDFKIDFFKNLLILSTIGVASSNRLYKSNEKKYSELCNEYDIDYLDFK